MSGGGRQPIPAHYKGSIPNSASIRAEFVGYLSWGELISIMLGLRKGVTVSYLHKLFHNEEMLGAAWNSLLIGLTASAVSTVLGTMAGYAMYRFRLRLLPILVVAPIAIPEILMGVSLLIFFVAIDLTLGLMSIILAHIAFCVGFVAIVVRARLAGMAETLVEGAR